MPLSFKLTIKILKDFGYVFLRQCWSHKRFQKLWIHNITVPEHKELKPGTAKEILDTIAKQNNYTRKNLTEKYNIKL